MSFLVLGEGAGAQHRVLGAAPKTHADLADAESELPVALRERAVALHDPGSVSALLRKVLRGFRLPTEELVAYFGLRAGGYFAFMDSYTRSMVVPSAIFFVVKLLKVRATPSRVAAMRVASRIAISLWALRLLRHIRRLSPIAMALSDEPLAQKDAQTLDARRKRIAAMRDPSKPAPNLVDYIVSAATTSVMLVGVGSWILFSMNCQGYIINPKSRFAVGFAQRMAAPGGMLDTQHALKGLIAPITHSQVMAFMNVRYSRTVERLSVRDGSGAHGTIAKRLCFEMMDNFMPITWLALVRQDAEALATEVVSCYQTDEVRRMATETVIPYALLAIQRNRSGAAPSVEDAADLDEWEDFDEWLEMITQFAYICFLGPDSPVVFPLSLLSNYLEQRSDLIKVCFCTQRPRPESRIGLREDMATWIGTLKLVVYLGVAMNCLGVVNILSSKNMAKTHALMC